MNSGEEDSLIVKIQFGGYVSHMSWYFQIWHLRFGRIL